MSALTLPSPPARVHFVGIGGIGMSGLARILRAWGYVVSGSDAGVSEQTRLLEREGIPVTIGHGDSVRSGAADLVVVTAAVRPGNLEIDAATSAGVPVVKRAQLLGALANARTCVAVAGSHGKSTTSGMLVSALQTLGGDPSFAVGAVVATAGTNAAPGSGPAMVVEADEYDYSFLWLTPDVAIITNVDYDHPDIFPDQAIYDGAFVSFANKLRAGGRLIIAGDDPGVRRVLAGGLDLPRAVIDTFGESDDVDWHLRRFEDDWIVEGPDDAIVLRLAVPGRHNARNATAALLALRALGYDGAAAAEALSTFRGVGRRFECKGEANGVVVVDDYAHHPAEIRATIIAARERFPDRRLVIAFQPHTFSRTKSLLDDFARSFDGADEVVILAIYPSRETDSLGVSSVDLIDRIPAGAIAGGSIDTTVDLLANLARPGDVVVTAGAGDITSVGPKLLERLNGSVRDGD